jgi:hypothetical protein
LHYMIFREGLYTEKGDKAAKRVLRWLIGFVIGAVLTVLWGALTGRLNQH